MPLTKSQIAVLVKIAVLIWGGISLVKGAGLEFFMSGTGKEVAVTFCNLVYGTVLIAALLSFLSSWLAGFFLLSSTIASSAILIWTNTFGHGLSSAGPFILDIIFRPALGSLVFFLLSRWVKDIPVATKLRLLMRK